MLRTLTLTRKELGALRAVLLRSQKLQHITNYGTRSLSILCKQVEANRYAKSKLINVYGADAQLRLEFCLLCNIANCKWAAGVRRLHNVRRRRQQHIACVCVLVRVWVRVRVRVQCVMPPIRAADKKQRRPSCVSDKILIGKKSTAIVYV